MRLFDLESGGARCRAFFVASRRQIPLVELAIIVRIRSPIFSAIFFVALNRQTITHVLLMGKGRTHGAKEVDTPKKAQIPRNYRTYLGINFGCFSVYGSPH